ncbi:MAG: bifunctional DNA-formamidopyrimidine glycosylase/DNA-(apurinic or apyrimidinic site) lyase [Spirochaetales bacterium]|nr:bifunctional DNA-formamidopyrimidine glycosylase/DNA-(apurinic or apyrimidinic site) lyase [Spirochaetales bacterium]
MPELPEVETVVRALRREVRGARVEALRCHCAAVVADREAALRAALCEGPFVEFTRHGKYIFMVMAGGSTVAVHLRMTGQLFLAGRERPPDPHTHLEILLVDSRRKLVYRDVRKFGRFQVAPEGAEGFVRRKKLGPDALAVTPDELLGLFCRTRRCTKAVLLDQRVVAGLGNIYTDEALFRARVAPLRPARELSAREVRELCGSIREVLYAAIADRGTTISDYVGLEGTPGGFQFSLRVYGRQGQPCARCGTPITRTVAAGRGTWYCPVCQR